MNVFESRRDIVYFYIFNPKKSSYDLAGEDAEYKFEIYKPELKALDIQDLKILNKKNIDSFIYSTLKTGNQFFKPMFSIGIQSKNSNNLILNELVNKLYQNSYKNIWKVRLVNEKENFLADKIYSEAHQ